MKSLTSGISNQIKVDEQIIGTLSGGFDRSKALLSRTLGRMDSFVGEASASIYTYIVLFLVVIFALIYKFII